MGEHMTNYSAADLLNKLKEKGFITPDEKLEEFITNRKEKIPLYLKCLSAVGAFIAALFILFFLAAAGIIRVNSESGFIITGILFIVAAIVLRKNTGDGDTINHSFGIQLSIVFMAVGKMLFVAGVAASAGWNWSITFAILIVTLLTYHIYDVAIDRFLSSYLFLSSISWNIIIGLDSQVLKEILFNSFIFIQIAGTAILFTHEKIKDEYKALAYALVFSICKTVLFLSSQTEFGFSLSKQFISPVFINFMLIVTLIAVIAWAVNGVEKLKTQPLILAVAGVVLLGFISAPGILLAIILMVFGYAKHDRLLTVLGILLTPYFLSLYYYSLDISLLQKSGILFASGIILLLGNFYIRYKGLNKGAAS